MQWWTHQFQVERVVCGWNVGRQFKKYSRICICIYSLFICILNKYNIEKFHFNISTWCLFNVYIPLFKDSVEQEQVSTTPSRSKQVARCLRHGSTPPALPLWYIRSCTRPIAKDIRLCTPWWFVTPIHRQRGSFWSGRLSKESGEGPGLCSSVRCAMDWLQRRKPHAWSWPSTHGNSGATSFRDSNLQVTYLMLKNCEHRLSNAFHPNQVNRYIHRTLHIACIHWIFLTFFSWLCEDWRETFPSYVSALRPK